MSRRFHKNVLECSNCNMSVHISEKLCDFCGSRLHVDKLRHMLSYNIPYLSFLILVLLLGEVLLPLNHAQERIVLIVDEFILVVFLVDISLDKYLYRGNVKHFLRRRAVDILFVLPLLKTLKIFEALPVVGRSFRALHAVQHVSRVETGMFFDISKGVHMAKYAKYAYPAFLRK